MKISRKWFSIALLFVWGAVAASDKPSKFLCNGLETRDWSAWNNKMPGSDMPVIITGVAETRQGGWKADLSKRKPQGKNSKVLQLDLKLKGPGPGDLVTQVTGELQIRYREPRAAGKYEQVEIFCEGKRLVLLKVADAH